MFRITLRGGLASFGGCLPALGMAVSLLLFAGMRWLLPTQRQPLLETLFAAASVVSYYLFRLPSLIGFSLFSNGDEVLIDFVAPCRCGFHGGCVMPRPYSFWSGFFLLPPSSSGIWMPRPRIVRQA